jgi:nucleotide-binding universal stress UspA family protein
MIHVVEPLSETARSVLAAYMPEASIKKTQENGMKNILADMKVRIKKYSDEEYLGQPTNTIPVKEMIVVTGRPSEQILTAAKTYKEDMIVMGQSSKKVLGSKVMGSSARRVARLAKVPILIIPNI